MHSPYVFIELTPVRLSTLTLVLLQCAAKNIAEPLSTKLLDTGGCWDIDKGGGHREKIEKYQSAKTTNLMSNKR